ncbi:MAG: hypothetical protein JXR76_19605 [Deltaproteobacteria bacterium]|nr:hypothetical protein [Deltaproteobacteria bacterium]
MPLIKMQTASPIDASKQDSVMKSLSDIVAKETGKPAAYVMVTLEQTPIMMGEKNGDAAFFDVRSIGSLSPETNASITKRLCQFCNDTLNIPAMRVYVSFTDVARSNWGWNNDTF